MLTAAPNKYGSFDPEKPILPGSIASVLIPAHVPRETLRAGQEEFGSYGGLNGCNAALSAYWADKGDDSASRVELTYQQNTQR